MTKTMAVAIATLMLTAAPVVAQHHDTSKGPGDLTAEQVGVSPMTGTSDGDYVMKAADGDMFETESSKVALQRSKRKDVRSYAQDMIRDHRKSTEMVKAAVKASGNKVSPPATMTPEKQAKVDALKSAPEASFDQMYLDGQRTAHQEAWALHKGYATDGADPNLKGAAGRIVKVVEKHYQHLQGVSSPNAGAQ